MRKLLKLDSKNEKDLQEVEELMRKKGITITSYGGNGLVVSFDNTGMEFWLQSTENGEKSTTFPRMTEDERLVLWA